MATDNSFVFEGNRKGDLYIVDFSKGPSVRTCLLAKATEGWLWHRRLGHAGMRNLQTLVKKNHLRGIPDVKFDKDRLCAACEAGKLAKKHHSSKTVMTTTRPLEILHMDLFGPQNYASSETVIMVWLLLMIFLDTLGYSFLKTKLAPKTSSKDSPRRLKMNMKCELSMSEATMVLSSKILISKTFSMKMVSLMNSQPHTLPNRMELLSKRIELLLKWREQCSVSIKLPFVSGLMLLTLLAML